VNNSVLIAVAIVAAAVILRLPLQDFAKPAGRYQIWLSLPRAHRHRDGRRVDHHCPAQGWRWQPYADNGAR
jgi:hypothetical protein